MFSNHISVTPLPVLLFMLPLAAALLIFCLASVKLIFRYKAGGGKSFELGKRPLKIIFLLAVTLETVLSLYVWHRFQHVNTLSYVLSNVGWFATLTGMGGSAVRTNVQIDVFSAAVSAITSLVAFAACLRALADKENELTPKRSISFLLTLGGAMGVYFSGGLINLFISLIISQVGAFGLGCPVLNERVEFSRSVEYFISRFILMAMFLGGFVILGLRYDVFSYATVSVAMQGVVAEKLAFILLAVPLLYLFIEPTRNTSDSACRCYFAIMAQTAFFAFFRIVFTMYGAVAGLERVPALIGVIGLATVFAALMFASDEREPIRFATAVESVLKGFIMIALSMSLNSIYSAAAIANYGYGALEAMLSCFLLFLTVSAALSVSAAHLKQESGGVKLWLTGGNLSQLPFTGGLFALAVCVLGGLPPFIGYAGRQFLYRSANLVSSLLALALFAASLFVLFIGLRYISTILFGRRSECAERFRGDSTITLPLIVLFSIMIAWSILPEYFHEKIVSPSANFLINEVRHIADDGRQQIQEAPSAGEDADFSETGEDGGGENSSLVEQGEQPEGSG